MLSTAAVGAIAALPAAALAKATLPNRFVGPIGLRFFWLFGPPTPLRASLIVDPNEKRFNIVVHDEKIGNKDISTWMPLKDVKALLSLYENGVDTYVARTTRMTRYDENQESCIVKILIESHGTERPPSFGVDFIEDKPPGPPSHARLDLHYVERAIRGL